MDIQQFNTTQLEQNNRQIAIDFDGVIHANSKGFYDGTIYDEPIPGAIDAIKSLYDKGYSIIIFTAKAKNDRPLINNKTGKELVTEWLYNQGILNYISDITSEKPRAKYYIDDKAIKFENWNDTLKIIE